MIEIKNQYTGATLLTVETLTRANLSGAALTGADLTGANLSGAALTVADLTGADLSGANLTRANLSGAALTGADLTGANLTGANLTGADLHCTVGVIALGSPDGWFAYAWMDDSRLSIRVGYQEKRLSEARGYWAGKPKHAEVRAAVEYAASVAAARGWAV